MGLDEDSPARLPRPERVVPVMLGALGLPVDGPADRLVTGVTASSDDIRPGDLFAALPGATTHGARFAAGAVSRGAVAVLTDPEGHALLGLAPREVPVAIAANVRRVLGEVSSTVYGDPSSALRLFGVTGTSGKTTTTFFLRAALSAAGLRSGLVGTVATMIGDDAVKTRFTTPEAPEVHALLAVMRERGVTDVAMEVSSHALDMERVGGIRFDVGAFTNLSQDHLDYHPDMAAYFQAKVKLFDQAAAAVIAVDDEWGRRMAALVPDHIAVSSAPADGVLWWAEGVSEAGDGSTTFALRGPDLTLSAGTVIPGRFNVQNVVVAVAMLHAAGLDPQVAVDAIATASVPGRMERIDAGQDFLAVVDYSHKPAAVEGALSALRPLTRGRLIIVLGCGGDRDHAKRPLMGAIAARDADVLVVTDDNPRSEDPAKIRLEMLGGVEDVPSGGRATVLEIGDRAEAIAAAVGLARSGDTVLVAGKGHETGQEVAGVLHPFDDRTVLRAAIEASCA